MPKIAQITAEKLDIALSEPFGIATGAQAVANNVLVRVILEDGSLGIGEAAPFPAVNGETQTDALFAAQHVSAELIGQESETWPRLAALLKRRIGNTPSACCAIESAILDAHTRSLGVSLWRYFGGRERELETDITVVTGSADQSQNAAARAVRQGFRVLKVKVGGTSSAEDTERVFAIARAAPHADLILDANASMSSEQAIAFIQGLDELRARLLLFEQPTPPDDFVGLARVEQRTGLKVAADESARSVADVTRLVAQPFPSVINLKIMKSGVHEAFAMMRLARRAQRQLMIGGMVESRLAMTVSACLAAGVGGFRFVDLDTPLFMPHAPLTGGFEQIGPRLTLDGIISGHGVSVAG